MQFISYFTAISLYMFRAPSTPIIRSTYSCSYSHRYKPYVRAATSLQRGHVNPYPTAFLYGNGMVLHFYQQQESSTTKTVHKVINKGLKAYV